MIFAHFKNAVAKQFERMAKHELFRTGITKDDLWGTYLGSFPPGSNPIYKTRTEHDCQCCKQFIRAVGDVVAIIDGKVESIWDCDLDELGYQTVAMAMSDKVRSFPITDTFLHYERTAGTNRSLQDTLDGVKAWEHFHITIPAKFVKPNADIPTVLNTTRTKHDVFERGLRELTIESLDTILELIAQNSLYRGEEHKFAVIEFRKQKMSYDAHPTFKTLLPWANLSIAPDSVARFRNTSIGTLAIALSEGTPLEDAVRAFEAMVAPANYKRPIALVTKAMIEKAKKTIDELGLTPALERRYATIDDITINNVMFADRSARKALGGNVFDDLTAAVPVKSTDKVEEVTIDKFMADILPHIKSMELMVDNTHAANFVTLVAPVDPTAPGLFKWSNNFSWSYNGDFADSVKERVKKAGGNVTGDLCCRLAWFNHDDLDFHMVCPNGMKIYFGNKRPYGTGGELDVDMNAGCGTTRTPVENIVFENKLNMCEGRYTLFVHQFSKRESVDVGFEVEIDFMGTVHRFAYPQALASSRNITVAEFDYSHKAGITFVKSLPSTTASRQVWGVPTMTFQKVEVMMMSPNHWNGQGVGNRHYFFMLENCRNEGQTRPFFNEFLKSELDQHRKVLEMVGAKMRTDEAGRQLSGLGFSSTQRNSVLCRVTGSFARTLKIVF